MNLLIDIGNTRIKYVQEDNGTLSTIEYCAFSQITNVLNGYDSLQHVLLVSVSNQTVAEKIASWARGHNIVFKKIETEASQFGICNSYQDHRQMGADRWLAIVGAQQLYPNDNVLIIDSGTATTFDVISHNKQHIGGWIIPGLDMMMNSLFTNTDKVIGEVGSVEHIGLAQNTNDNVNQGCWAATLGAIESAKSSAAEVGVEITKVIFTGGNGLQLDNLYHQPSLYHQSLIFIGLQKYLTQC